HVVFVVIRHGLTIAAAKDVAVRRVVLLGLSEKGFLLFVSSEKILQLLMVSDKKLQLLVLSDIGYYMFLVLGCEEDIGIKHIFVLGDQEISDR
ncbi:hypothetical protein Tco_0633218, partial [Tanacetum coccineum]